MFKTLTFPLLLSLFFHGVILAVLLIDAPQAKPTVKRATPNFIRAELITLEKPKAKKTTPKPVSKPKPKPKPKPKVDDGKAKQLAEQQKQQAEQQRQAELNRQAKDKQQREALEKQQQLERIQQQSANELDAAIAEEQVLAQSLSDDQLANSYIALITEVIQNNWNRPPSARNAMEAELLLQLVPTGEVVSVKVLRSSGNAAFDRSAENAVLKAERFPELQKLPARVFEQNFRRLRLKFKPEDLRL